MKSGRHNWMTSCFRAREEEEEEVSERTWRNKAEAQRGKSKVLGRVRSRVRDAGVL